MYIGIRYLQNRSRTSSGVGNAHRRNSCRHCSYIERYGLRRLRYLFRPGSCTITRVLGSSADGCGPACSMGTCGPTPSKVHRKVRALVRCSQTSSCTTCSTCGSINGGSGTRTGESSSCVMPTTCDGLPVRGGRAEDDGRPSGAPRCVWLDAPRRRNAPHRIRPASTELRGARGDRRPETFTFLGFTHYCARSRDGRFVVKRRTDRKRLTRKLHTVRTEQRRRMHTPLPEQHRWLCSILRGHYRYYGLPSNLQALDGFYVKSAAAGFARFGVEASGAHVGPVQSVARPLSSSACAHFSHAGGSCWMIRTDLGRSRVRESRTLGSVGAKLNGLATRPSPETVYCEQSSDGRYGRCPVLHRRSSVGEPPR